MLQWRSPGGRLLLAAVLSTALAGAVSADDFSDTLGLDELRSLVEKQQRSIEELRMAVDDLSAARAPAAGAGAPRDALGEDLFDLGERTSQLERIAGNTRVGGWLDFVYGDSNRSGQDPFFDVHHVYLYFDTRIDERWQALAELELEHTPEITSDEILGEFKLDRAYLQYNHSEMLNFRLGKFRTSSGYWTPVHWAILVDTIQKPIHEDNHYVPPHQVGLEIFGDLFDGTLGETPLRLEYAGWLSNGSETFATNHPEDGKFGYGSDLRAILCERLLLGFSAYSQHNPKYQDRHELSFVLYSDLQLPFDVTLRGEFMHQGRKEGFSDVKVGYAKIRWDFRDDAYLNYRFGIGDDDKRGAGERHIENVITLGYSPITNVRFRAEWAHNSFRAGAIEDHDVWGIFAGIFF